MSDNSDDLTISYMSGLYDGRKEAADEIERLREALRLGSAARDAQRAYFKDRTQSNLVASKVAEKAFDEAVRAALGEGK